MFASPPNGGILTTLDLVTLSYRQSIIEMAEREKLPAIYGLRPFTKGGGLISYGSDAVDSFRRAASYVDRILKGGATR